MDDRDTIVEAHYRANRDRANWPYRTDWNGTNGAHRSHGTNGTDRTDRDRANRANRSNRANRNDGRSRTNWRNR